MRLISAPRRRPNCLWRGTVNKTIELKMATGEYWTGEAIPTNVNADSNMGALNTWSITFQANDGLTKTSVTAVA